MLVISIILLLVGFRTCKGHHILSEISINGIKKGLGTCIRVPPNTKPLTNLYFANIACNINGNKQVAITCGVNAGSKITLYWSAWPDGTKDIPLDVSHQGPCAAYMKRMKGEGKGKVAGSGWFKIYHYGFQNGKFCTEKLRDNGGKMVVTIPKDLAGGYYILRGESLALHQAKYVGGAQWYIGCVQLFVFSTGGNQKPTNTVSIPGYVNPTHPGVLYDYWANTSPSSYKIPGPAPYVPTNNGGGDPIIVPFNPHPKYSSCIVKNANWCAVPIPQYNSESTCWKASANCWDQLGACYSQAPITGSKGCEKWQSMCKSYEKNCKDGY